MSRPLLTWSLADRGLYVVRGAAFLLLLIQSQSFCLWILEFVRSTHPSGLSLMEFAAPLILKVALLFLWLRVYSLAHAMVRERRVEARSLQKIGWQLIMVFALQLSEWSTRWFMPHFSFTRRFDFTVDHGGMEPLVRNVAFTLNPENLAPYLTPMTNGWTTLILAVLLLSWAAHIEQSDSLKKELSEIV